MINSVSAETPLTGKQIFQLYRGAVVQVWMDNHFRGTGFLISADGLVVTANHVVSTRDSRFRELETNIKVFVDGKPSAYPAVVVPRDVQSRTNYDSAVLKIEGHGFQHLSIGNWNNVDVEDQIFIIPHPPDIGTMLLTGIVSGKGPRQTDFGPLPVNMILFQCPVRNGFSGAPIFISSGSVIGIVDTKVFGIAPALDELRTKWMETRANIELGGVDIRSSFIELINNLDQNLISGLGSGVDISYARDEEQSEKK
jgi:S1-C subfamily serine protease